MFRVETGGQLKNQSHDATALDRGSDTGSKKLKCLLVAACFQRYSTLMTATDVSTHIRLDERGVAWIDQTRVKVIEVAMDHIAYGWSAEEIHRQHPHLSLAQTHAALAFYYDHQAEFEKAIAESVARTDKLSAEAKDSPGRLKLRALGLIP